MIRLTTAGNLNADFCRNLVADLKPDAIIGKHDLFTAMMSRHLADMGVKIGQDIMLAGFDDEPIARLLPVPLTTIRFPVDPFVQVCYERLANQISKPEAAVPCLTLIDIELVVRASTGVDAATN
jgi:LacI family transcriptional regulator